MEQGVLKELISIVSKLPGLGPRSARRIVLHLLTDKEKVVASNLNQVLQKCLDEVKQCSQCGNLSVQEICHICADEARDHSVICLVENVSDIWAMERNKIYKGGYHVLGGCLSAMKGVTPEKLSLNTLKARALSANVEEIIIALSSTLEGQTTGFYVADFLKDSNVKITRLAHGIPIGAELEYMDEGTIMHALKMRQAF